MEIQAGSIVYSKAGRDKSKVMLVIKTEGEYAYVADGELRTVGKPKKKKFKHLQKTNTKAETDCDVLADCDVRRILAEYKPNN